MLKKSALALAAALLALTGCDNGTDAAFEFYVTDGSSLFVVNGSNTMDTERRALTGLNAGTQLYGIDVNPRGGSLTGIGSDGQVYAINPGTGAASLRGAPDTTLVLQDRAVELDYNPRAGAGTASEGQIFRVTTSTGENYRRNDSGGAPATFTAGRDSAFAYRTGDVNAGKAVVVSGIAYTNSQLNTVVPSATTVYAIDSLNDTLTILGGNPGNATAGDPGNPNAGQLTTVGNLGLDVSGFVGFDILNANTAYAVTFGNGGFNLYTVNLGNGAMTLASVLNPAIGPVRAFAVRQQ